MEYCEKIWHLFAKSLNKESSPVEQQELAAILDTSPALAQQYDLLSRIWNEHNEVIPEDGSATSNTISKIIFKAENEYEEQKSESARVRRRVRRFVLPIATAVLVTLTGLWIFNNTGMDSIAATVEIPTQQLVAQKGSRSRFLLPDGTVVWLNAGSNLSLENDFEGSTREVRLDGEAYFNVQKNDAKPFIVHTSGINIKVLGTVFNVKAYAEDENIETTLLSGSVKVFTEKETEAQAIRLEKNQKLVMRRADHPQMAAPAPPHAELTGASTFAIIPMDSTRDATQRIETAWLYSRLEFRGDDFEKLAHKLERWYNINIEFRDEEVKKLNFNGSFEKETAEQAFMALRAALPKFSYSIKNQVVSVGSAR